MCRLLLRFKKLLIKKVEFKLVFQFEWTFRVYRNLFYVKIRKSVQGLGFQTRIFSRFSQNLHWKTTWHFSSTIFWSASEVFNIFSKIWHELFSWESKVQFEYNIKREVQVHEHSFRILSQKISVDMKCSLEIGNKFEVYLFDHQSVKTK